MENLQQNNYVKNNEGNFSLLEIFALISVGITILWQSIGIWITHIDGAARVPFFFSLTIFFLMFSKISKKALKFPLVIYAIEAVYLIINGYVNGATTMFAKYGLFDLIRDIYLPVLLMIIIATVAQKNFNKTLKYIIWILLVHSLLCLIFSSTKKGRMNGDINANEIAMYSAICVGLMLFAYVRQAIKKKEMPLIALPFIVTLQTGSRMGMAMIGVMLVATLLQKINFKKISNIIASIIVATGLTFGGIYVMNNTLVGERFAKTTTTAETLNLKTGTILDYYGDRGFQYYASWPYFLKNPVTGIGFRRWIVYSPSHLVCHSEYMVQYVENGLIAFTMYLIFWIGIMKPIIRLRKCENKSIVQSASMIMALLITIIYSNSVLWSYNIYPVFAIYALAFAFAKNQKKQEE